MTLNTKIGVLWIFWWFGLRDTFQKRIAPKFYVPGGLRTRASKKGASSKCTFLACQCCGSWDTGNAF